MTWHKVSVENSRRITKLNNINTVPLDFMLFAAELSFLLLDVLNFFDLQV